ncbi:hypothetical protein JCM19302_997 [Jejuia pallidilutea]|nr:hypothetical protein JCM19302_997 [Jejuia pallidilutea]
MLRFATPLDTTNTTKFKFLDKVELNKTFIKQFTIPYSLKTRIVYKLKGLFG